MGIVNDSWELSELNRKINKYERKLRQLERKKTQMDADLTDINTELSNFTSVSVSTYTTNIEDFGVHGVKYCDMVDSWEQTAICTRDYLADFRDDLSLFITNLKTTISQLETERNNLQAQLQQEWENLTPWEEK